MVIETYFVSKKTGRKYRLDGYLPSTRQPSKPNLRQAFRDRRLYGANQLPPKTDLRKQMTSVENQAHLGSCTANALAGAYEYLTKKGSGQDIHVSRLFVYYNSRVKQNQGDESNMVDQGCTIVDTVEAVEESGTCLEPIWPYDESQVNTRPSDKAYDQAKDHKITSASMVERDLNEMKSCLAQGFPFAIGVIVYQSFMDSTGVVPMPSADEYRFGKPGGHALLVVGYSDKSQSFIVRNSWGEDWGDNGYCYMPYEYLTSTDLCKEAWTIRKLETNDFGQDHWDRNDSINYKLMAKA